MAAEVLGSEIKCLSESLEINADAHKEAEGESVKGLLVENEQRLKDLSELVETLGETLIQEMQGKKRTVLKELIPILVIRVSAHCGRHYWTSAASRKQARDLLLQVLHICGCPSMLELLVGELPSGPVHTSPYLPLTALGQASTRSSATEEDGLSTKVNLKCVIHDNDTPDVTGSQLHSDGSVLAGDSVFVSRDRQCGGFQGSEGIGGRPALPHNSLTNLPEKTLTENSQPPLLMDSQTSPPEDSLLKDSLTSLPEDSRTSLPEDSRTGLPMDGQTSLPKGSQTSLPADNRTSLPADNRTSPPEDSRTGLPMDGQTSLPKDSQTSLPVDNRTSPPEDSRTGLPMDGQTNLPKDSQTSPPEDSQTSLPMDSQTSLPDDSQTSLPKNSQTSLPDDSRTSPCCGTIANSHDVFFRRGLLKPVMSILKNKLTKESWKKQPTAKHALVWCLRQLKHPHLGVHLDSFLPPLLMLLDDHEIYHRVLGLSALTHLIKNVDPTELRWNGRADVVYQAIRGLLHANEVDLIHALHPCMLCLLPILEGPQPRTVQGPRKPSKSDEVFAILLNYLDFESKIAVRKAYVQHISSYIELLGIYIVRHLKRLLQVLFSCLEFPDYSGEETRKRTLKALGTLMRYAWPRIPYHKDDILKALLKLVSDLCPSNDEIPDKPEVQGQLPLVTECLVILARCCENMEDYYCELKSSCNHSGLLCCLDNCFKQL